MCRLYGMRANEPTRVECSLVRAQNALMAQSRKDSEGLVHGHGWGVADYRDGLPLVEKQVWAAFHGEHFEKAAARIYAHTAIAHVRRATVGEPSLENTHPFHHGPWIFAHNGTIPHFLKVRDRMMPHIDPLLRNDIRGTTDSEHVFYYMLTEMMRRPDVSQRHVVGQCIDRIVGWSREVDPEARIGLNILLTNGNRMIGSRLGRTLWHLSRDRVYTCQICGRTHTHHHKGTDYRAVEIASEPITDDPWEAFQDGVVFSVDEDYYLLVETLEECRARTP